MAKVEIICPHCNREQTLPTKRLYQPWVCLVCGQSIDDPYMCRKSDVSKLAIPLQGKIISTTGITNLSEIVAESQAYSGGFSDAGWNPHQMQAADYTGEWEARRRVERRQMLILMALMAIFVLIGLFSLLFYVIIPML
jgi:hypothetical protein